MAKLRTAERARDRTPKGARNFSKGVRKDHRTTIFFGAWMLMPVPKLLPGPTEALGCPHCAQWSVKGYRENSALGIV